MRKRKHLGESVAWHEKQCVRSRDRLHEMLKETHEEAQSGRCREALASLMAAHTSLVGMSGESHAGVRGDLCDVGLAAHGYEKVKATFFSFCKVVKR
jgi:hypothetical protein